MKHRVKAKHFNRDVKSRKALLKNLLRDLFTYGQIKTSEARVKEVRRLADKLIVKAKQNTLAARRELHEVFGRRDVVNTLVDKIAPSMQARQSGFSSLHKLAARRGDNTMIYKLSLLVGDLKLTSLKKAAVETVETAKSAAKPVSKAVATQSAVKAKAVAAKSVSSKKAVSKKTTTKSKSAKKEEAK